MIITAILAVIIFAGCNHAKTNDPGAAPGTGMKTGTAPGASSGPSSQEAKAAPANETESRPLVKKNPDPPIPILYYHAVSDRYFGLAEMFVTPAEFDQQMNYLKQNNYTPILFDQLDEVDRIEKPVLITFDDGYENNYTDAYPILKKYGFRATIFPCTAFIGQPRFLKTGQIKEMTDLISFQSHAVSHEPLAGLGRDTIEQELAQSKKILEELTGQKVVALAYPYGSYNEDVLAAAIKHYNFAVTNRYGFYYLSDHRFKMLRLYVPRGLSIEEFRRAIEPPS
jgi:peptidoglycan/xylan/chitin deacetylase (PgdA/CDA1 family)